VVSSVRVEFLGAKARKLRAFVANLAVWRVSGGLFRCRCFAAEALVLLQGYGATRVSFGLHFEGVWRRWW
jgi:hypothetical protein